MFQNEDKELTKNEYLRLLSAAKDKHNVRLHYIIEAICATGIRVSEHQFLTVEALKVGVAEINNKGKIRTILIPLFTLDTVRSNGYNIYSMI